MKLLQDIYYKVEIIEIAGSTHLAIPNICFDSRKVTKDCLFVATKGTQSDGNDYIEIAIEKGAVILPKNFPNKTRRDYIYKSKNMLRL